MKKYFIIYAVLTVSLFAGLLLYAQTIKTAPNFDVDYAAVNEIVKQAQNNWTTLEALNETDFMYRFVIIDTDGRPRYFSAPNLPNNMPLAIKSGFLPIDISVDGAAVGKALIETSQTDEARQAQIKLANAELCAVILLCVLNLAFLFALDNAIVKPFRRLEKFAHKISVGNFDEPLPIDRQNIFGLFTQSFDIMRTSLFEAKQSALQAERAKKEVIAQLSHDIKTPATSIRLIAELLQAGEREQVAKEKLATIEQKADQIDRLVNDMLHSALEELGELKVNAVSTQSSVLRELFANADQLSKVNVSEIPPCLVEMDVSRMEQIIGNIITNSYKYAGTEIETVFKIENDMLRIDITDNGGGVEADELELVTTKFYRGKNAKELQKDGEGLGLYIAKILMEKMCGELEVFGGSGFTVRLWVRLSR